MMLSPEKDARLQALADATTLDDVATRERLAVWRERVIGEVGLAGALDVSRRFWARVGPTVAEWGTEGTAHGWRGEVHRVRVVNPRWSVADAAILVDAQEAACGAALPSRTSATLLPPQEDIEITCPGCGG